MNYVNPRLSEWAMCHWNIIVRWGYISAFPCPWAIVNALNFRFEPIAHFERFTI
jgi:hypothetical protein